jgi:hypothetical protein
MKLPLHHPGTQSAVPSQRGHTNYICPLAPTLQSAFVGALCTPTIETPVL